MSIITKSIVFITILFLLTGCVRKKYSSNYYSSDNYKKSKQYKKIQNQEMRNSDAMHRATMRPYVVFGKKYYPTTTKVGNRYKGIASWYGPKFHAKKTSNGEIYDMFAYTAASKTLPMNTMVRVHNLENNKETIVRINDRGPFVDGRIIDLSNVAARQIDMVKKGTAKVELTVIGFNGKIATTRSERSAKMSISQYVIQVGAFSKIEGAKQTKNKFNNTILDGNYKATIKQSKVNGKWLHRVLINGFRSMAEAEDFKKENGLEHAMVIGE